jgi:hypothetical protein
MTYQAEMLLGRPHNIPRQIEGRSTDTLQNGNHIITG